MRAPLSARAQRAGLDGDVVQVVDARQSVRDLAVVGLLPELDDDGVAPQLCLEVVGRALRHHAALVDDRQAARQTIGLFQVVRREEDLRPSSPARRAISDHMSTRTSGSRPVVGSSSRRAFGRFRGGPLRHDFPANHWWTAGESNP